ncbi:hypothetical protein V6W80_10060 [Pseudomonas benzopyrenica]|uniref:Phage Mu protein F like protein n=1 Tax=Pseudomonas benzopyrenica TaxID=2993566 RepID=A0ABZ2FXH4_9PSED
MNEAEILAAMDGMTPALQRAYLDQIRATVDAATIVEVERLIAQQDDQGLVATLALGAFAALLEAIRTTYIKGGTLVVIKMPGGRRVQFDQHAPVAQQWLTQNATDLIATIAREQAEAIRVTTAAGRAAGRTPRQIALDVVGRLNPRTGLRAGGVLGLSAPEAQAIASTRDQLSSGVAERMRQYLAKADRDQRLDGIVHRAIQLQKPVAAADVQKIATAYADRKIKTHALLVAKAQAHEALNAGFNRLHAQLLENPVRPVSVEKIWRNKGDLRVRHAHVTLGGVRVGFNQPFQSPTGARLNYPGDKTLGASWADLANCRCTVSYRVTWK